MKNKREFGYLYNGLNNIQVSNIMQKEILLLYMNVISEIFLLLFNKFQLKGFSPPLPIQKRQIFCSKF